MMKEEVIHMNAKSCPLCGTPFKKDQKFCTQCGAVIPQIRKSKRTKKHTAAVRICLLVCATVIVLWAATAGLLRRGEGSPVPFNGSTDEKVSTQGYDRHTTELDLSYQNLTTLAGLSEYTELTTLILNGNEIKDFSALANMPSLTHLELEDNCLTDISFLHYCPQLQYLNLSKNAIQDITPVTQLTDLVMLDISHNQLSDIDVLSGMPYLTYLNSSYNPFGAYQYLNVSDLPSLEVLDVSHCRMQVFSDSICAYPRLKKLDISYNGMTLFADSIQNLSALTELEELNVSYNTILDTGTGVEPFNLPHLRTLTINPVGDLLYSFNSSGLPELEKVNIVIAAENSFTAGYCVQMKNDVLDTHPSCEVNFVVA